MPRVGLKAEEVRRFIVDHVANHPNDIVRLTAGAFGLSRQAVHRHIETIKEEGLIKATGNTRNRSYELVPLVQWARQYPITQETAEDVIWRNDVRPILGSLPANVISIWEYCITEMINNAIDHSGGKECTVYVDQTAAGTSVIVEDDGVGIFRKIQAELNLLDERHAIVELSKGKLTTDPSKHSGQGIFFTSRLVDEFSILSGETYFGHKFGRVEDWILQREDNEPGTAVIMGLSNHATRTAKDIFDQYSSPDDYGFIKTVVPVTLAKYGEESLVSRSQAKRLLSRVELFKKVIFDFAGVETIGQAFADQIFRVFANEHPDIEISAINGNPIVNQMISRARASLPAS